MLDFKPKDRVRVRGAPHIKPSGAEGKRGVVAEPAREGEYVRVKVGRKIFYLFEVELENLEKP